MKLYGRESVFIGEDLPQAVRVAADAIARAADQDRLRSVVLAGGSTPARLYGALSRHPNFDWRSIHWFFGDERCVPPDHADSNYRMARETLLDPLGVPVDRVHRMPADAADLDAAAARYEQTLRRLVPPAQPDGPPELDLVLLGIGTDGHTASLFPGSPALGETRRLVVAHEVPSLGRKRMTMTLPLLRAARRVIFFVTGSDKAEVLARILREAKPRPELPASLVREGPGWVEWILDPDAGALLVEPPRQS